jgi:hypothetical protein
LFKGELPYGRLYYMERFTLFGCVTEKKSDVAQQFGHKLNSVVSWGGWRSTVVPNPVKQSGGSDPRGIMCSPGGT